MTKREELDAVTVQQIRVAKEQNINSHLETLCKLVRMRNIGDACKTLDVIKSLVEDCNRLDCDAGLPGLYKMLRADCGQTP